jgi:hypothetical protein
MNTYKGKAKNAETNKDYAGIVFTWVTLISFTVLLTIQFIK